MAKVRTRFAPSPTGYMHIGNLRTALYAFLLARKENGTFILRIEDTDQERYVEGAVDVIYKTLKTAGISWDEGPDVGGDFGPYVQSQRKNSYLEFAKKLVESGEAYYCFCDKHEEENDVEAEESSIPSSYPRTCRDLSKEVVEANLKAGKPFVIRQKMPLFGNTTFHDMVYGDITVENEILEDQILIKRDGMPTYNFANVIDDHSMNVTHIVRGNEYLSSTPKYNLLYTAFGWDLPTYIHCAPVMKDAQHKLSKRNGDAAFEDLIKKGFLPQAVINYIALLGWAPKSEQEIFTLEELISEFDIDGISKSPAIFDPLKLTAINAEYIRNLPFEDFENIAMPYINQVVKTKNLDLTLILKGLHPRCEILTDIPPQVDFIDTLPDYDIELYSHKKMKTNAENSLVNLKEILPVLEGISEENWDFDTIHNSLFELISKLEVKNGLVLWPLRVALSGKPTTPGGGVELAVVLGKKETLKRTKIGIDKLS